MSTRMLTANCNLDALKRPSELRQPAKWMLWVLWVSSVGGEKHSTCRTFAFMAMHFGHLWICQGFSTEFILLKGDFKLHYLF